MQSNETAARVVVDTKNTVHFYGSRKRLLLYCALSAGMLAISMGMLAISFAMLQFGAPPEQLVGGASVALTGGAGVAFSGGCTLLFFGRLFTLRKPAVTLGPDGVRDIRVASGLVLWADVNEIWISGAYGPHTVMLALAPEAEKRLRYTTLMRLVRGPNRWFGVDGYPINTTLLDVDAEMLVITASMYAEAQRTGQPIVATQDPAAAAKRQRQQHAEARRI